MKNIPENNREWIEFALAWTEFFFFIGVITSFVKENWQQDLLHDLTTDFFDSQPILEHLNALDCFPLLAQTFAMVCAYRQWVSAQSMEGYDPSGFQWHKKMQFYSHSVIFLLVVASWIIKIEMGNIFFPLVSPLMISVMGQGIRFLLLGFYHLQQASQWQETLSERKEKIFISSFKKYHCELQKKIFMSSLIETLYYCVLGVAFTLLMRKTILESTPSLALSIVAVFCMVVLKILPKSEVQSPLVAVPANISFFDSQKKVTSSEWVLTICCWGTHIIVFLESIKPVLWNDGIVKKTRCIDKFHFNDEGVFLDNFTRYPWKGSNNDPIDVTFREKYGMELPTLLQHDFMTSPHSSISISAKLGKKLQKKIEEEGARAKRFMVNNKEEKHAQGADANDSTSTPLRYGFFSGIAPSRTGEYNCVTWMQQLLSQIGIKTNESIWPSKVASGGLSFST